MSDINNRKINNRIEIPKLKLWIIWLFLFVIPSIIAIISYKYYSNEYFYFKNTYLLSTGYERIRRYNNLIIPENFLEEQLIDLKKNLDSSRDPKELKKQIDTFLCGESINCFFFDENIDKLINIKSDIAQRFKNIPTAFLKNYLKKAFKFKPQPTNLKKEEIEKDSYEAQIQLGIALQQLYKTVTSITISLDKVANNFSVLYEGELYFVFCKFDKPSKDNYGFLAVLRGKDFSFHKMLERLNKSFPEIRIIFREIDINKATENPEIFHSGIKHTKKGTFIVAPTSAKFARHVVHGGSERIIDKYGKLLPLLEYHIPIEKYNKANEKEEKQLKFFALIIILFSGVYSLHISLFGFNEKFSFKNKILLLTLIASIFPFSVFALGMYGINNYNRFMKKSLIQIQVETKLQLVSRELEIFLADLEYKVDDYGSRITKKLTEDNLDPSDFLSLLTEIEEKIPLSTLLIYLDPVRGNLEQFFPDNILIRNNKERTSKELINEENDAISFIVPAQIMKEVKSINIIDADKRERKDIINLFKDRQSVDIDILNDWLIRDGKMKGFYKSSTPIWYICNYLQSDKDTVGIFITKFEPKPILAAFFASSSIALDNYRERIDNYEVNYAFLPIENSGSANIWNGNYSKSFEDRNLVLHSTQTGVLSNGDKTIIKKRNQKIPHLAVATITEIKNNDENNFILLIMSGIFAYLFLVLYFSNKLLDIMFVEPVMLLASNASAIARGGDKWDTIIKSGDEFEELNNSFKKLVTGLQERNVLKSYVSEDAFSDIEGSDNVKLLPGGEYLEATIVFSAIKDYDKLSSAITPQESIKLLSKFMSIAEEVTKKYGGSIDKIIGDTIMLVFRDNPKLESHGLRAAQASLELVGKAKKIGLPKLYTGIASGRVISGRIGSYSGKLDFTVIGNPVNSAARFKTESKNGTEETGIIISGTTIGLMKGRAIVKFLRRVDIKGKQRKYNIYELLGVRG